MKQLEIRYTIEVPDNFDIDKFGDGIVKLAEDQNSHLAGTIEDYPSSKMECYKKPVIRFVVYNPLGDLMGHKVILRNPRDCCDYNKVERFADQNGVNRVMAGGDHVKLIYNGPKGMSEEVYCRREMGTGLGCKIFKWFKAMGLIAFIGFVILILAMINNHPELIYAIFPNLG